MADVQPYVLRYWESEFPLLGSSKSGSGPRLYTEQDLEVIRRVKQLLYDEGYTIAGAKKRLENELKGLVTAPAPAAAKTPDEADAADDEPPLLVPASGPVPPPLPRPRRARAKPPRDAAAGELVFEETSLEPPAREPAKAARSPKKPDPFEAEGGESAEVAEEVEDAEAEDAEGGERGASSELALEGEEAQPAPAPRTRSKARPKPEPEITAIELASLVEPPSFPDPRLALAIAELKEILKVLSRDPE